MKIAFVPRLTHEINSRVASGISVFSYALISKMAENPKIDKIDVLAVGKNYFSHKKIKFISLIPGSSDNFLKQSGLSGILNSYSMIQLREHLIYSLAIKAYNILSKNQYDLIHDNSTSPIFSTMTNFLHAPIITTLHTQINSEVIQIPLKLGLFDSKNHYFITVSKFQQQCAEKLKMKIFQTIHNGINLDNFVFSDNENYKDSYLLWHGRIHKTDNKGLKQAIQVNNFLKNKLHVVGVITDKNYFQNDIKTIINSNVSFFDGNMNLKTKNKHYQSATCFIYPLMWEEPFGLVFLESMACGTPIVSFARGAVPEIIKDGVTGFIVNPSKDDIRGNWVIKKTGIQGLQEAVKRIYSMDINTYQQMRKACRKHVEDNFSIEKMADGYERVYEKILNNKS